MAGTYVTKPSVHTGVVGVKPFNSNTLSSIGPICWPLICIKYCAIFYLIAQIFAHIKILWGDISSAMP